MKKSISLAIYTIMMAIPVFFASCGNDDLLDDEPEVLKPTITSWTEPWHIQGSTMDEVKNYMTNSMSSYSLIAEYNSAANYQLVYSGTAKSVGVTYSFTKSEGALYSVIDTELCVNKNIILKYLNDHYSPVPGAGNDEQNIQYLFTTADKSTVITTSKVSDDCFNVSYSFVTR